jgi:hypothetical protein
VPSATKVGDHAWGWTAPVGRFCVFLVRILPRRQIVIVGRHARVEVERPSYRTTVGFIAGNDSEARWCSGGDGTALVYAVSGRLAPSEGPELGQWHCIANAKLWVAIELDAAGLKSCPTDYRLSIRKNMDLAKNAQTNGKKQRSAGIQAEPVSEVLEMR